MAWEQEQEAKQAQRQAELQKQLEDMQAEVALLKAVVSMQQQGQASASSQGHMVIGSEPVDRGPPLPVPSARIEEVPTQVVSPSPGMPSLPYFCERVHDKLVPLDACVDI